MRSMGDIKCTTDMRNIYIMPENVKTEALMGDLCVRQIYLQNRHRMNTVYIQSLFYALVGS